ncbi:MAG: DUF58 domain-containing protein [Planctomycetes bacterium]|nr:DUF58 domain-containing protein [Planctomycetota bacterium]MCH9727897.1 DUF58 domain-containing protein [Planctomycetota bacterium]MCH9778332.1 DUF58 domain-containing protein [Planctomycetota bacterium]MCH9792898.1 DUF58 domain-containing protein [Planctomycetota bacterium]MDF1742480.1 DUF58 domain-containing protein [Gimesia sp.]
MLSSDAPLTDPTALARFGKLEVVTRLIVEGFMMGQHKSPYKGASVEFVEHRQYYPGDEIRHIDWRAYGKTGKYYVKEFEEETNLRCYLLLDCSGSMAYAGQTLSKFDYARQLAAALGYLLLSQRDATGLVTFDTERRDFIEPSANTKNFGQMMEILENSKPRKETAISGVLNQVLPLIKRRSLVVLISDCFDEPDALTTVLKQLRHDRHEVLVFQIVAPEEEEFPFSKPTQFRSLERNGHRQLVDPHQLRARYLEQYQEFCETLSRQCGSVNVDFLKFRTTDPYHLALGAFLNQRTRPGRK